NNIAWRNVNVVNLSPLVVSQNFNFRVRNLLQEGTSAAALEVRVPEGPSFLEQGDITLTLDPELWANWGKKGTGFEVIGDGVVRITDPSLARLDDLQIPSQAGPMVQVTFSATEEARAAPARQFAVQVVQYSETDEARGDLTEVGGVGYDITVGVTEP
ncbi:hypothetical protein JGU66_35375, partial [Myxococcaceae bacterium JPH2]|nr:hypothetical protein [Myxococcaceae bacterium JPH2]